VIVFDERRSLQYAAALAGAMQLVQGHAVQSVYTGILLAAWCSG